MAAEPSERSARVAFGALTVGVAAPAAYVAQRLFEVARGGGEDLSLVLAQSHVGFYWRAASAVWFGLAAAVAAAGLVGRGGAPGLARAADRVRVLTLPLAALLAFAAWRWP